MKKFVILILIGSFAILGWGCKKTDEQEQVNALENQVANEEASKEEPQVQVKDLAEDIEKGIKISFIADFEGTDGIEFKYKGDNITVYSLLELVSKEKGLSFDIKDIDFGKYVFAIGGKEGGQDGKYWNLYINGNMSDEGVDRIEVKPGDQVEFKLESSEEQIKQEEDGEEDKRENQEGKNIDENEEE